MIARRSDGEIGKMNFFGSIATDKEVEALRLHQEDYLLLL